MKMAINRAACSGHARRGRAGDRGLPAEGARGRYRHAAFLYGPHRCVGSHLARREVIVAIEEWLARVPELRIKAGTAPVVHAGFVFGIEDLELAWD